MVARPVPHYAGLMAPEHGEDQSNVAFCDWCHRRVVGLGGKPPIMTTVTVTLGEERTAWRICGPCDTQFRRLRGRMGRPRSWGTGSGKTAQFLLAALTYLEALRCSMSLDSAA